MRTLADSMMDEKVIFTAEDGRQLTLKQFDEASNHQEKCECEICQLWHLAMPPEEEADQ